MVEGSGRNVDVADWALLFPWCRAVPFLGDRERHVCQHSFGFCKAYKMPTPISRSLVIAIRKLAENEIFRLARVESLNFMMLSAITRGGDSVY